MEDSEAGKHGENHGLENHTKGQEASVSWKPIASTNKWKGNQMLCSHRLGGSLLFEEGIVLVTGKETSLDCLPLTRVPLEVATTGKLEGTDPTAAVTTGDLETDGSDMPLGPVLIAERPVAPTTRPLLRFLVEVGLRLTADVVARCAGRRGGRR